MKKTIASFALLAATAATSASAMPLPRDPNQPPPEQPEMRTICLETAKLPDGSVELGDCDMVNRNERNSGKVRKNGCPRGQVAITSSRVEIAACPTAMQL